MQSPERDDPAATQVPPAPVSQVPTPPDPPAGKPDYSQIPRTPLPADPPAATPLPPIPVPTVQHYQAVPHVGMFHPQSTSAIAHAELTWR